MSKIKKHDFIEIEYTGKLEDGGVFDTTSEKVANENHIHNPQMKYGPVVICIGEHQVLKGIDDFLLDKEAGKDYNIAENSPLWPGSHLYQPSAAPAPLQTIRRIFAG